MSDLSATPYADFTSPELVRARDTLGGCLASVLPDDQRVAVEWLHAYATEELARRLSDFVQHADGLPVAVAADQLAFEAGIVRGPKPAPTPIPLRRASHAPKSLLLQQPDGSLRAISG